MTQGYYHYEHLLYYVRPPSNALTASLSQVIGPLAKELCTVLLAKRPVSFFSPYLLLAVGYPFLG